MKHAIVLSSLLLAAPGLAEQATPVAPETLAPAAPVQTAEAEIGPVVTRDYHCERGAQIPAVYINDSNPQRVVLMLEGRLVALSHIPSADGAKYAEDGEGVAGYIWWTKGMGAMLDWVSEDGETQQLLSACQEG